MYDDSQEPRHSCLACGDPIPYGGRNDSKFCSDKCRHSWNNGRRSQVRFVHLRITHAIEKNYRILESLIDVGIRQISFRDLEMLGFRREYMTSFRQVGRHRECSCFEISYLESDTRIWQLEKTPAELLSKGTPPGK